MPKLQPPTRYPTTVRDVTEVSLTGTADPAPWTAMLERCRLRPQLVEGRAELLLLACAAAYKGKRFRELSLSIAVSNASDGASRDGVFLVTAFNSVRFFAWVERAVFKTPYVHADVTVDAGPLLALGVSVKGQRWLRAEAGIVERASTAGDERWEGPIHLPPKGRRSDAGGRHFFGCLEGPFKRYAFDEQDRCVITPGDPDDGLGMLTATSFRPTQWQVRVGAVHSRSKTYRSA